MINTFASDFFHYPCNEHAGFEYLRRFVKIEFGSLTDQRPVGLHEIRPRAAEEFPGQFEISDANLWPWNFERTFWEKATILHMEYHRDKTKPLRDRFSRHYSDMAELNETIRPCGICLLRPLGPLRVLCRVRTRTQN